MVMDIKQSYRKSTIRLTPEQKDKFNHYIPKKVYQTEKNVTILMALSQLAMMSMYLFGYRDIFYSQRSVIYFSLYTFLFVSSCVAIITYWYTVKNSKIMAFLWVRRIFALCLSIWILGISYVEQLGGNSITVYFYFIPTLAAMMMLTSKESILLFLLTWIGLIIIIFTVGAHFHDVFGDIVNSFFVTVLAVYISYRYYRSTAIEFVDRDIIKSQYEEIENKNILLQRLVHVDQLTDLYNRHYLIQSIYPHFEQLRKERYYGVLLMSDIDYFKQFNDTYGHTKGDECIQLIASKLKEVCKQEDAIAIRFGGEEFLMIKFSETKIDATSLAQRILCGIRESQIQREDTAQRYVSISLGVWEGCLQDIEGIEQGIKLADDALYAAKKQGRNRIVYATQK